VDARILGIRERASKTCPWVLLAQDFSFLRGL
jgi:hypothetical protein